MLAKIVDFNIEGSYKASSDVYLNVDGNSYNKKKDYLSQLLYRAYGEIGL